MKSGKNLSALIFALAGCVSNKVETREEPFGPPLKIYSYTGDKILSKNVLENGFPSTDYICEREGNTFKIYQTAKKAIMHPTDNRPILELEIIEADGHRHILK